LRGGGGKNIPGWLTVRPAGPRDGGMRTDLRGAVGGGGPIRLVGDGGPVALRSQPPEALGGTAWGTVGP